MQVNRIDLLWQPSRNHRLRRASNGRCRTSRRDCYGREMHKHSGSSGRFFAADGTGMLADRFFFAALSEALEDVYATIRQGRIGQGS